MIALIGHKGSIGRRYGAILSALKVEWEGLDDPNGIELEPKYEKAIIATPTDTHYHVAIDCIEKRIPFLVEKPLSMAEAQCRDLANRAKERGVKANVVCNYAILHEEQKLEPIRETEFDYYHTGKDGPLWDVCQLIYLHKGKPDDFHLGTQSPVWTLRWNGIRMTRDDHEWAYVQMIQRWLKGGKLYTLDDGLRMTQKVNEYERLGI